MYLTKMVHCKQGELYHSNIETINEPLVPPQYKGLKKNTIMMSIDRSYEL